MERSNSLSSNTASSNRSGSSSGPFAYQTRLLERTSSTRSGGSVSRNNSISGMGILTTPTGGSSASTSTRRWTPSHRVANSLDTVRGKWEERSKDAIEEANAASSSGQHARPRSPTSLTRASSYRPSSPSSSMDQHRTPTHLKRQTMPSPIIASPLSPNTTGVTVEADSSPSFNLSSSDSHRIRLPSYQTPTSPSRTTVASPEQVSSSSRPRSSTFDTISSKWASREKEALSLNPPSSPSRSPYNTEPPVPSPSPVRSNSLYGSSSLDRQPYPSPLSPGLPSRSSSIGGSSRPNSFGDISNRPLDYSTPSSPSSVMSPPQYRSSYMQNKKATYGDSLLGGRRKLGNHLPRIASGDGEENSEDADSRKEDTTPYFSHSRRENRPRKPDTAGVSRHDQGDFMLNPNNTDDVAGIPGRMRLSRNRLPNAPVPLPSSRLTRGLWADAQRQYIQAYEYLCHVGEAQQWIEGCLGEELGFGVVEMEEGLRNGVVLAKLVRAFRGEAVVKKIYDAPKLDFRHSDNINVFFTFVRDDVKLPECFIFELTDLYNKKNLPKVIYCIHALGHLLARRGMAGRIGNLLGRLQFTDDQLQRTQKDLKMSGVPMPNFGNVGKELAKEINEEPEVEEETEDERRDRLLLENESSITAFQAIARGYIARNAQINLRNQMQIVDFHVQRFQGHCFGYLARRRLQRQRSDQARLLPWAIAVQAQSRGVIARHRWHDKVRRIRRTDVYVTKMQAQIRGVLVRRRCARLKAALRTTNVSIAKIQALSRAALVRKARKEVTKSFFRHSVQSSIVAIQAHARGVLTRRRVEHRGQIVGRCVSSFVSLQAHCRGVLVRRRVRNQLAKLEDVTNTVIRIQAASRTFMARKRLLNLIRSLRKVTPVIIGFQARARANIARQQHYDINKSLTEVKTIASVGGLQARARAFLARNRHQEVLKNLETTSPDVTALQAAIRALLVQMEYRAWRDHLHNSEPVATFMQALFRGVLQRRRFRQKMDYYRANLSKVVKIQSLFRAKETREQYRQLTMGKNVTVGTIKNFVHLLDDSETDFQEEIKVERLRKQVVESIRANQALESDLKDLEVKIGLVVQNAGNAQAVKSHRHDTIAAASRSSMSTDYADPFSGPNTLDQAARRKLELYQQLFHLLQTHGEYLSRFFLRMSMDDVTEKNRRFTERIVLTLFAYGQDRREDYLLLKLFQLSIRDEIRSASSIEETIDAHPMYIDVAAQYIRPKQIVYAKDALQQIIRHLLDAKDLDLEADPTKIRHQLIESEEMRTGIASSLQKDVSFHVALQDPGTRAEYIRRLQTLRAWTEAFMNALLESTRKMPYSLRYLARETLLSAQAQFPGASEELYAACIGRIIFYRCIYPAILAPEMFDIVPKTIDDSSRTNLDRVSRILIQIISGRTFTEDTPIYVPINDFISNAIKRMVAWLLEVANVPDAESQFHAHEFLDATVQPKPIYISPNEIYNMHSLLSKYQQFLAPDNDDPLKIILSELGGVPNLGNDEFKDARDIAITLELTNRFADVQDPHAEEKTLWVQAKRGVLAILRVQPAQDLVESLLRPVTDEDELVWEDIVDAEIKSEQMRHPRRQPSQAAPEAAYRLDDIRSLNFRAVKALAISYILKLEEQGKISRNDGFQGILNAIAGDVRSKHRKRLQRQQEMESMNDALKHLADRKKQLEEQIESYNDYATSAMTTMQRGKGKKRFVLPFSKQYFHQRELQKLGKEPRFGSFIYTAKHLYDRGILLSIDQYSPRQFDKLHLTLSSDTPGVFTLLLESTILGGLPNRLASEDVRMEALLQAKYEKRSSLPLFNGKAQVNLEQFLYQINKKFYA